MFLNRMIISGLALSVMALPARLSGEEGASQTKATSPTPTSYQESINSRRDGLEEARHQTLSRPDNFDRVFELGVGTNEPSQERSSLLASRAR